MDANYTVTVTETKGKELSKKDLAAISTNLSACTDIGSQTEGDKTLALTVLGYARIAIHNERSKGDKDYEKLILLTDSGLFITGSPSFVETFLAIWDAMEGEDPDSWGIEAYQCPSANFKGKSFITCKVI